jgi:malate/lactate dehydrogenase
VGCAVRTASETLLRYNGAAVRILVVGTGGVGSAFAGIARRRSFFEHCALADYEAARPKSVVAGLRMAASPRTGSTRRAATTSGG